MSGRVGRYFLSRGGFPQTRWAWLWWIIGGVDLGFRLPVAVVYGPFHTTTEMHNEDTDTVPVFMYYMFAALAVSVILNIILTCVLYKLKKYLPSKGLHPQMSIPAYTADNQKEESLQYVALDFKKKGKARRQTSMDEKETTYSALRQTNLE
ncbi:hypothetical protein LDENG_00142370 [Lucifuga dentata]|nr:hypothetical protein LDENG_00142370 [Lucifuga dentata]